MNEDNEDKIINCNEISKLINAFPKDIAALDKRSTKRQAVTKDLTSSSKFSGSCVQT